MSGEYGGDSLLDIFLFETNENIKQLEEIVLENERQSEYSEEAINEIFRIMHTIKGSASMMLYNNVAGLAHRVEDLFSFIREKGKSDCDYSLISDLILESVDFFKGELGKIESNNEPDGEEKILTDKIEAYLISLKGGPQDKNRKPLPAGASLKNEASPLEDPKNNGEKSKKTGYKYKAELFLEDGCQMESLRAFNVIYQLQDFAWDIDYYPEDIAESDNSVDIIREKGFSITFSADKDYEGMQQFFLTTPFLRELHLEYINTQKRQKTAEAAEINKINEAIQKSKSPKTKGPDEAKVQQGNLSHSPVTTMVSVNVNKLDKLMDLIGEMVISQAMVVHNPDLKELKLDNFNRAAQQLKKITGEMQDVIMSVRMVPLTTAFQKNNRIVRDMCKKLNKDVRLEMVGEDTEVDKNIIEHISDPLMHLIRNSLDHGIESPKEREAAGKPPRATITLTARNEGGDVLISVSDDGRGIDKNVILEKAAAKGLLTKNPSEMTDKEIYSLIFLPGFSTNQEVTEYSGRGVGMDVVVSNIEEIGGRVYVESNLGLGTKTILRLPITLAIIEGMNLRVGSSMYTIPINDIQESFRAGNKDIIRDPDGNEMIMVRGGCYPIVRLYERFEIIPDSKDLDKGILIMIENQEKHLCLFVDELIGQQEVVVKALPYYIRRIKGLAGCTLLGDGNISLILDVTSL